MSAEEQKIDRIVVIGSGAVGGCIGGLLNEAGFPVALIARGENGWKIRDHGLTVKFPTRTITCKPDVVERVDQVEWQPNDVAIIATKLYDAEGAMDELLQSAGSSVPVVCAFNGMQGERWATSRFESVISMLIWMPSTHLNAGEVLVYGDGCPGILDVGTTAGDLAGESCIEICGHLKNAGFDSVARKDIRDWKYAKWITNLGNTAQALIVDDWKSVAKAAQAEGETVLDHAKVSRVSTRELLDRASHVQLKPIDNVKRPGGSTWQSFKRGKPLETRWIEGAMADLADEINVGAPVNRFLSNIAENRRTATASEAFAFQRDK